MFSIEIAQNSAQNFFSLPKDMDLLALELTAIYGLIVEEYIKIIRGVLRICRLY